MLATQRPRGAVSDGIRANTNLRIAMRMSDRAESEDVIDAPDAAAIPAAAPGRSIALGGRRPDGSPALVAFQAAYAGGRSASLGLAGVRVAPLRYGRDEEPAAPVVSRVGGGGPSDLDLLVEATRRAAADAELQPLAPPWLPPLPERLALDDLPPAEGAVIGLLDEPDAQRQRPFAIDLARDGSLLVYGASGSGKTVLLQTLACALAEQASPSEMQLYGLDFASGELRDIEVLPHCGSVVRGDEEERVLRLLGGLGRALADRKQRPADEVAGLPRVVLLLDGYGAFASALDRVGYGEPVQLVARLAAEGRSLGIHVVATADRRADVPGALSGVVQQRIVLRLAAADEYAALGVRGAAGAPPAAGRGFTGDGRELQVALAGDLEARGERLRSRSGGLRAPSIGTLADPRAARPHARPAAAAAGGARHRRRVAAAVRGRPRGGAPAGLRAVSQRPHDDARDARRLAAGRRAGRGAAPARPAAVAARRARCVDLGGRGARGRHRAPPAGSRRTMRVRWSSSSTMRPSWPRASPPRRWTRCSRAAATRTSG